MTNKPVFRTQWDYDPTDDKEDVSPDTQTEQAGYRTTQQIVEGMINAGDRLDSFRRDLYDLDYSDEDGEIDPTRSPNFDLADASAIGRSVSASLAAQAEKVSNAEVQPTASSTVAAPAAADPTNTEVNK